MAQTTFKSERAQRWFDRLNDSDHMLWLVFVISFFETIIIPIPIELVLIPLMAINRSRTWAIAAMAMGGCLAASVVGFGVGTALYESAGVWFIEMMGYQDAYASFQTFFDEHGFWAIFIVGILPIPFQVAMITAGLSGYPLTLFVIAAFLARGIRYFGLAWLVHHFGERAKAMWQKHALVTSLVIGGIIIAFYLLTQYLASRVF